LDFDGSSEGGRFALESAQKSEALLLGRVTYEAIQAFWPTAEGELADKLNKRPKDVVSSTLTDPPWNATVSLGDDWPEEVARLRKELDGEIVVYGSRRLSHALIGMGLVDQLRLLVYRWCSVPGIACSERGRARSHGAWSNRARPGKGGEHDLALPRGRVMRTLGINSRDGGT
jgi:dihydrofolate reductase